MSDTNTVIFDFDGTLVDSFALNMRVSNMLAPLFGYRTVRDDEVPGLRKLPLPELFKQLEMPLSKLPLILSRAKKELGKEMPTIRIFDGMSGVIERLRDSGVGLGIVTSNSKRNVLSCLESNGLAETFHFIHSASNLFGKHRILRGLMRRKGLNEGSVVYVGDEGRDIEASKRCKIPVIAVSWGYQDTGQLMTLKPDFLAEAPQDIEHFVRSLFKLGS